MGRPAARAAPTRVAAQASRGFVVAAAAVAAGHAAQVAVHRQVAGGLLARQAGLGGGPWKQGRVALACGAGPRVQPGKHLCQLSISDVFPSAHGAPWPVHQLPVAWLHPAPGSFQ